jgi:hypothetical protein
LELSRYQLPIRLMYSLAMFFRFEQKTFPGRPKTPEQKKLSARWREAKSGEREVHAAVLMKDASGVFAPDKERPSVIISLYLPDDDGPMTMDRSVIVLNLTRLFSELAA